MVTLDDNIFIYQLDLIMVVLLDVSSFLPQPLALGRSKLVLKMMIYLKYHQSTSQPISVLLYLASLCYLIKLQSALSIMKMTVST